MSFQELQLCVKYHFKLSGFFVGYTNLAGMCAPGRSVTVMEDSGMSSFVFAAHLLGHRYFLNCNRFIELLFVELVCPALTTQP